MRMYKLDYSFQTNLTIAVAVVVTAHTVPVWYSSRGAILEEKQSMVIVAGFFANARKKHMRQKMMLLTFLTVL